MLTLILQDIVQDFDELLLKIHALQVEGSRLHLDPEAAKKAETAKFFGPPEEDTAGGLLQFINERILQVGLCEDYVKQVSQLQGSALHDYLDNKCDAMFARIFPESELENVIRLRFEQRIGHEVQNRVLEALIRSESSSKPAFLPVLLSELARGCFAPDLESELSSRKSAACIKTLLRFIHAVEIVLDQKDIRGVK